MNQDAVQEIVPETRKRQRVGEEADRDDAVSADAVADKGDDDGDDDACVCGVACLGALGEATAQVSVNSAAWVKAVHDYVLGPHEIAHKCRVFVSASTAAHAAGPAAPDAADVGDLHATAAELGPHLWALLRSSATWAANPVVPGAGVRARLLADARHVAAALRFCGFPPAIRWDGLADVAPLLLLDACVAHVPAHGCLQEAMLRLLVGVPETCIHWASAAPALLPALCKQAVCSIAPLHALRLLLRLAPGNQPLMLASGCLESVMDVLRSSASLECLELAARLVATLAKGQAAAQDAARDAGVIDQLVELARVHNASPTFEALHLGLDAALRALLCCNSGNATHVVARVS